MQPEPASVMVNFGPPILSGKDYTEDPVERALPVVAVSLHRRATRAVDRAGWIYVKPLIIGSSSRILLQQTRAPHGRYRTSPLDKPPVAVYKSRSVIFRASRRWRRCCHRAKATDATDKPSIAPDIGRVRNSQGLESVMIA